MPQLVDTFLERALKERIEIRFLAIILAAQAMQRDGSDPLLFIGVAKDKARRGFIEIVIGERKHQTIFLGQRSNDPVHKCADEELLTRCVERATWNRERALDARRQQKTLF